MLLEHISVSRSKTYKQCAQHYKYHYHLKLKSPVEEPFYFIYGKIIHKIAEEYVTLKGEKTLDEIWRSVKAGEIEIEPDVYAPPLPPEYAKRLPKHLKAIQNLTKKIGTDGIVEHPFLYDLDPPNEKFVKGFIDRLIFKGDHAFIIDYKTTKKGKWRVNKSTVKIDPQLRMYARVVNKEFGIPAEKIQTALYYLEDEELVSSSYTEQSLLLIEQEMLDVYNQIESHDPDNVRGNVGFHCNRCPFESICTWRSSEKRIANWDGDMSSIIKGV